MPISMELTAIGMGAINPRNFSDVSTRYKAIATSNPLLMIEWYNHMVSRPHVDYENAICRYTLLADIAKKLFFILPDPDKQKYNYEAACSYSRAMYSTFSSTNLSGSDREFCIAMDIGSLCKCVDRHIEITGTSVEETFQRLNVNDADPGLLGFYGQLGEQLINKKRIDGKYREKVIACYSRLNFIRWANNQSRLFEEYNASIATPQRTSTPSRGTGPDIATPAVNHALRTHEEEAVSVLPTIPVNPLYLAHQYHLAQTQPMREALTSGAPTAARNRTGLFPLPLYPTVSQERPFSTTRSFMPV